MTLMKKYDDAVSPVVGVMLMVVITVVIAAVIAVFASGMLGEDTVSDPVLLVDIGNLELRRGSLSPVALSSVEIIHKGGDSVPLETLEISLVGTGQHITNYYSSVSSRGGTVEVIGKASSNGEPVMVEPGDVIKITLPSTLDHEYGSTEKVTWALYNVRTGTTLANGAFVVPESV